MRKTFAAAFCCACFATLGAAVFAGGSKDETTALIEGDEAGQERPWGRPAHPVRYDPFGVEVIVGGSPLEQLPGRGRVYVEAVAGSEYVLRIRNPLPVRVAVALSVDGLNTIDARRTTARDASKWVVQPYGTITVTGWQMSQTRARRFYFTSERDSYAKKLGRAADVGVITAVFFRERAGYSEVVPPSPRPLGESSRDEESKMKSAPQPSQSSSGAAGAARNRAAEPARDDEYAATGIGRSVGHDVRWVNLDLERDPAAEVTLRYEYRPALVRLGVLPRHYDQPDPLRRRERARGFADPRFCPDPPQ
ncbi:MAG: hypothetical protein LC785_01240 [Acidobacteria bacterium]|nr:hypothetical protein [Acidobacteriota bacterium]